MFLTLSTPPALYCLQKNSKCVITFANSSTKTKPIHLQYPNKYKDAHYITFQAFSFDHLVEVLLKVINEISPITQKERKCTDILGEVMTMLFGLVNSKATDDAKGTFASKGANQVNQKCSVQYRYISQLYPEIGKDHNEF